MTLTEFWPNPIADRHAARSICLAIDVEGGKRSDALAAWYSQHLGKPAVHPGGTSGRDAQDAGFAKPSATGQPNSLWHPLTYR